VLAGRDIPSLLPNAEIELGFVRAGKMLY